MAKKRIIDLPASSTISATDLLEIWTPGTEAGVSKRAAAGAIAGLANLAPYVVVGASPATPEGRTLTAGTGIAATDGGPASTLTLALAPVATGTIMGNGSGSTTAPTPQDKTAAGAILEASQADAEAGTGNAGVITPRRFRQAFRNGLFYLAPGTGAVSRTINLKASDIVCVLDYGATGNGTTDDTAACQLAINAAVGKVLIWPPGIYSVTNLTGLANSVWVGYGRSSTLIRKRGTTANDFITFTSQNFWAIEGITIDAGDITTATAYAAIAALLCGYVQIRDCYISKFYMVGVALNGCSSALIDNNFFVKTAAASQGVNESILVSTSGGVSNNVTISNNKCSNSGIIVEGSFLVCENNWVSGWKYGAGVSTGTSAGDYYAIIRGNYFASGTGLDSDGFSLKGIENWSAYAVISGNICVGCSGPGIFNGGPYASITGNTCVNNNSLSASDVGGINIMYFDATNNGRGSVVTGNVCTDTGTGTQFFGVVVSALCDNVTVTGNALRGNVTGPFEIQGGVNPTIIWDGWSKGILDAVEYGVKANGSTNDAPSLNAAIGVVAALGGGEVHLPPGTIVVGSTIDNKYSNVLVRGAGRIGGPVTYAIPTAGAGTTIKPTFAGTVLKHRSPYGATAPKNAGGGFVDMNVVENGVATRLLDADSVFFASYRLYLEGTQGTETARFTCGLTGTDLADPCDLQYSVIDLLVNNLYSVPAQAADCVLFTGSLNADVSLNRDFRIVGWHKNGHVLRGVTADSNTGTVIGFRAGGGSGYTVYAHGPTASHAVGFSTNDLWVSGTGGAYAEGTGTAGVTAGIQNRIWWNDDGNGTPDPVAGTGSWWHFRKTLYDVDHNLVTNRLVGVDVDNHAQTQVAKFTTETARVYSSAGDFIRFDDELGHEWGLSIDGTNGNFRVLRFSGTGWVNIGNGAGVSAPGPFMRGNAGPVAQTSNFSVGDFDHWTINNKAGSSCTVTLPAAASWLGRELMFTNYQAQTLISASSNVIPLGGGAAGTAILAATAGKWATLVSNGTNWVITQAG